MSNPAFPVSFLVLLLTSTAQAEQVEITLIDNLDGDLWPAAGFVDGNLSFPSSLLECDRA